IQPEVNSGLHGGYRSSFENGTKQPAGETTDQFSLHGHVFLRVEFIEQFRRKLLGPVLCEDRCVDTSSRIGFKPITLIGKDILTSQDFVQIGGDVSSVFLQFETQYTGCLRRSF